MAELVDTTYADPTAVSGATDQSYLWIGFLLILLLVAGIGLFIAFTARKKARRKLAFEKKALKVILPKQQNPDEDRRDPKEVISVMEAVFSSLHYFYESNWKKKLWEGQPTFSFEVATSKGEIFFYVVTPKQYVDQLERQIHSQFPNAHIEPAFDYDIFLEGEGVSAVGSVQLLRSRIFPIKTY
jgi:hypothetical protein